MGNGWATARGPAGNGDRPLRRLQRRDDHALRCPPAPGREAGSFTTPSTLKRASTRGGYAKAVAESASEIISPEPAFVTDAAAKFGKSERAVREEISIANTLASEVRRSNIVQGTTIEDEKARLMGIHPPVPRPADCRRERRSSSTRCGSSIRDRGRRRLYPGTRRPAARSSSVERGRRRVRAGAWRVLTNPSVVPVRNLPETVRPRPIDAYRGQPHHLQGLPRHRVA